MRTIPTIQCKFCQSNLHTQITCNEDEHEAYQSICTPCDVIYDLSHDGTIRSFYLAQGDFFLLFEEDNTFTVSAVDDNYNEQIILTLPYWPENINPSNLDEKINLFKTFG